MIGSNHTSPGGSTLDFAPQPARAVELDQPIAVDVGPNGDVYFIEGGQPIDIRVYWGRVHRVQGGHVGRFDSATGEAELYVMPRAENDPIVEYSDRLADPSVANPYALVVDDDHNLYVMENCSYDDPNHQPSPTLPPKPFWPCELSRLSRVDAASGQVYSWSGGVSEVYAPVHGDLPIMSGGHEEILGLAYWNAGYFDEIMLADNEGYMIPSLTIGYITSIFHHKGGGGAWPRPMTPFSLIQLGLNGDYVRGARVGVPAPDAYGFRVRDVAIDPRNGDYYVLDGADPMVIRKIERSTGGFMFGMTTHFIDLTAWANYGRKLTDDASITIDHSGNLYVAFTDAHWIGKISLSRGPADPIEVFAGIPHRGGFSGDGSDPTTAQLDHPFDLAWEGDKLYVADRDNDRIRVIGPGLSGATPVPTPVCECGDGIVEQICGEECDDGNNIDGDGCQSNCRILVPPPVDGICGDGVVSGLEQCDDGNLQNGDGCDQFCMRETGYIGGGS